MQQEQKCCVNSVSVLFSVFLSQFCKKEFNDKRQNVTSMPLQQRPFQPSWIHQADKGGRLVRKCRCLGPGMLSYCSLMQFKFSMEIA